MASNVVSFTASATLAAGVGADVQVLLDGKLLGEVTVGSSTQTYSFNTPVSLNAAHDVQIVYTNDHVINGQDRNLNLQSISVNGQSVSATSPYEVYHANGQGNIASSGAMNWGGTAEFKLPASMFGGTTTTPPPSTAGFYVSTTGSDSGDGSAAHPFATIGRAVTAMEQSGTIKTAYLEGGTYKLGSTVNLGSKDSGITIESAPGAKAVLDGNGSLSTLVSLNGASNVTLQGLTFQHTGTNDAAV